MMQENIGLINYFMVHSDAELCFVVCRGPEAFFSHLSELEKICRTVQSASKLVIDQILVTGESEQRFVAAPLNNGFFVLDEFSPIKANQSLRKLAATVFRENIAWEASSILTTEQLARIQSGQPL